MPSKKKTARILEKTELRIAGLKAIDPKLSFGEGRNLPHMIDLAQQLRSRIDSYNTALTALDNARNEIATLEKNLNDLSDQMLTGVAFTYGKDSDQYEMAGGVKKSDRIQRSSASRLKGSASANAIAATKVQASNRRLSRITLSPDINS